LASLDIETAAANPIPYQPISRSVKKCLETDGSNDLPICCGAASNRLLDFKLSAHDNARSNF